jgi:hypothetical protein
MKKIIKYIKSIKIELIIFGSLALVIFLLGWWGGYFRPNPAQVKFKAIDHLVVANGGQFLCSNGDSGLGIDNTEPWHSAYYTIYNSPNLTDQIEQIVTAQGFKMEVDQEQINEMQQSNQYVGSIYTESFSPNNSYLHSVQYGTHLDVLYAEIYREGKIILGCTINGQYGKSISPEPGKAILHFELSLPSRG